MYRSSRASLGQQTDHLPIRRAAMALGACMALTSCGLIGPRPVDTVENPQIITCKPTSLSPGKPLTRFGPEDVVIDQRAGVAYLSVSNHFAKDNERAGYLLRLDLKQANPTPVDVTPNLMANNDFAPHGMSLIDTPSGGQRLFVVNHLRSGGQEIFVLDIANDQSDAPKPDIELTETIKDAALTNPNAIAAIDSDHIFVINTDNGEGILPTLFGFNRGKLISVARGDNGKWTSNPQPGDFNHGAGIAATRDRKRLYVSEAGTGIVHGFDIQPDLTGTTPTTQRKLGTAVDNIWADPNGTGLLIAAHPSAYRFILRGLKIVSTTPSEVIWLDPSGTTTARAVRIFRRDGIADDDTTHDNISASSVAAIYRQTPGDARIVIGSVFAGKVLICDMPDSALPPR